jgi:hypothetical protein
MKMVLMSFEAGVIGLNNQWFILMQSQILFDPESSLHFTHSGIVASVCQQQK